MIEEFDYHGIYALKISNGMIAVRILAGKGGDINQITLIPEEIDLLYAPQENLNWYEGKNLYINRLDNYSQHATGGWQDVVPGFGKYGELKLGKEPIGIAATVGWETDCRWKSEEANEVTLYTELPVIPLALTKTIRLTLNSIVIEETIENIGNRDACMTWTQHSVFGGNFLEGGVKISYPAESVFLSALYAKRGGVIDDYIYPIAAVPMPDGEYHDVRRMRERREDGMFVFTMKAERGRFGLYHEKRELGCEMIWDKKIFPYLRCFYQNNANGFAMALEPCNYYYSAFDETDTEEMYLKLAPGEKRGTSLQLNIVKGKRKGFL